MAFRDRYDLPITTTSEAAAEAYREAVDLTLSAWPGAARAFDNAIREDPGFALAYTGRSRIHLTYGEMLEARTMAEKARACAEAGATPREKSHVNAMALTAEGQPVKALEATLAHIDQWPADAMVMGLPLGAFGLFAFSGMADHDQARVDLCERYKTHYGNDDWWFLTSIGWAHTENGDVTLGRKLTQDGFERRRENGHAVHALLHAMFEDGSIEDAETLIGSWLPTYDKSGLLHGHIAWHDALLALDRGDSDRALKLFAESIQPKNSFAAPLNVLTDGASLLWRLHAHGYAIPDGAWPDIADYADRMFAKGGNAFAEIHLAMIAAAMGQDETLEQRVIRLEERIRDGKMPAGAVVPGICRALRSFAKQDYASTVKILEPVAEQVVRIGGSHAQRELVEDTLLMALMKAGSGAKAGGMLDARLHRRPSLRDRAWRESVA